MGVDKLATLSSSNRDSILIVGSSIGSYMGMGVRSQPLTFSGANGQKGKKKSDIHLLWLARPSDYQRRRGYSVPLPWRLHRAFGLPLLVSMFGHPTCSIFQHEHQVMVFRRGPTLRKQGATRGAIPWWSLPGRQRGALLGESG